MKYNILLQYCRTNMAFTLLYFRLFVKLSLAYVPKSKVDDPSVKNSRPPIPSNTKSAPLDLLLYDSLCWDCESSGKCNVRPKVIIKYNRFFNIELTNLSLICIYMFACTILSSLQYRTQRQVRFASLLLQTPWWKYSGLVKPFQQKFPMVRK